jgi:hypothetical protein
MDREVREIDKNDVEDGIFLRLILFFEKKGLTLKESTIHPQLYRKDTGKFGSYKKQLQTRCWQHESKPNSNSNSNLHKRHNTLLKPQESTPRSNVQAQL